MNRPSKLNSLGLHKSDQKFAVLIDPDKHNLDQLIDFAFEIEKLSPDYLFLGGSLIYKSNIDQAAKQLKAVSKIPLVLFPGHFTQLTHHVDHVLLLSLISGRNPDLLIGQHVLAAPMLKELGSKIVPTGYMLIEGGQSTSVSYMSHTMPIPRNKTDIAVCTAMAGEALGMKAIYMDAGSGAAEAVKLQMIREVADSIDIPLIVGGGIKEVSHMKKCWQNSANLIVIGNALEESASFFDELKELRAERIKQGY